MQLVASNGVTSLNGTVIASSMYQFIPTKVAFIARLQEECHNSKLAFLSYWYRKKRLQMHL